MAAQDLYDPATGPGGDPTKKKPADPSIDPSTGQPWATFNGISADAANSLATTSGFGSVKPDQAAYGGDVSLADYGKSSPAAAGAANVPYTGGAAGRIGDGTGSGGTQSGVLSGPGPAEQFAADHQGEFSAPSAAESLYATHGNDLMNTKSAAETLYDQGMAGTDPYYAYAQKKATQQINDAAAARGNWNSSAALYDIGDKTAYLRGQQAAGMKDEAALADQGRHSRYSDTEGMAKDSDTGHNERVGAAENLYGGWQNAQENRLGGAQSTATQLSKDQADSVQQAYAKAGDLSNMDNLEAFNAQLQKLGIDPKSSAVKDLISLAGPVGGAIAGKG